MNKWALRLSIGLLIAAAAVVVISLATSTSAVITVDWTTASELNTAGFNLYRSEAKDGTYTRLNTDLIPGSTDPLTGGSYSYTDTTVIAGHTYYYQLEDIETSGTSTRHDPYEVAASANVSASLTVALGMVSVALILGALGLAGKPTSKNIKA